MRTILCSIFLALAVVSAFAEETAQIEKETAVIHFSKLKEAKVEGTAKYIRLMPVIGTAEQTPYIRLMNQLHTPREVYVQILDLTEPEYDLYVDGALVGTKSKSELESGFPVKFSGTWIPPERRDYYTRLQKRGLQGAKRYESTKDNEADICRAVMSGVAGWVDRFEKGDARKRTVSIIVAPAGRAFTVPGISSELSNFEESVKGLGDAVQIARRDLQRKVSNAVIRHETLNVITPMAMDVHVSGEMKPGSRLIVFVYLRNWTDRLIKGKVKLNVPSDWRVREISRWVKMPGYSTTSEAKFEVTLPESLQQKYLKADAQLMVQDVYMELSAQPVEK